MTKNRLLSIVLVLLAYIISTATSYILLSDSRAATPKTPISKTTSGKLMFDDALPKTESCPLSGTLYSKQQRDWWKKHRPLGIMIENHEESRPQAGLSSADVIYEAVAEGSITRFLAVFYCQNVELIGPVRSARTYFLDFISEYGDYPLYVHVGGANTSGPANALGQIEDYGWLVYNDLSQFSLGFPTFKTIKQPNGRDVATEHTMFSSTEELWKVAVKRKLTNVNEDGESWDADFVQYSFKDDAKQADRPPAQSIHLEPWEGFKQYAIDWTYEPIANVYKRSNGGKPHIDSNTKKQLTAKNLVVLSMTETHANDGYEDNAHLLYKTLGSGKANIFIDGKRTIGTWKKDSRTARTLLFDDNGLPIKFDRGTIWFEILPTDGILTVK